MQTKTDQNVIRGSPHSNRKAIIGEKPYCLQHVDKCYIKICTAKKCKIRVLCIDCEKDHETSQVQRQLQRQR